MLAIGSASLREFLSKDKILPWFSPRTGKRGIFKSQELPASEFKLFSVPSTT